ncbi:cysteine hydrolase [Rhizobium sp. YJ-22]|nr:isochorismatase family cysteine hydrolase [Rhizobium sp. YJ-22]MDG3576346.1 cysteine hydrolase [Rhizobium sp. YJ-22]
MHVVIDMQRLFAEDTVWHTPSLHDILPNVLRLCAAFEARTLFAKFMLPETPDHAPGRWQAYYRRWSMLTGSAVDPACQDLVAPLAALAAPEVQVEKFTYSVFKAPGFAERLRADGIERLVFSGVETDVCVLASVFDAVDAGFHVVVVSDAVGSSDPAAHRATLDHILARLPEQIDILSTADIVAGRSAVQSALE